MLIFFALLGRPSRRSAVLCFDKAERMEFFTVNPHLGASEKIFPLIDDPRAMNEWNPFVKADPNIKLSYCGPPNGVGAANDFDGNNKVGGRPGGNHRVRAFVESCRSAAHGSTDEMPEPRRIHDCPERERLRRHLGDERQATIHGEVVQRFRQHRENVSSAFETGLADLKARAEA